MEKILKLNPYGAVYLPKELRKLVAPTGEMRAIPLHTVLVLFPRDEKLDLVKSSLELILGQIKFLISLPNEKTPEFQTESAISPPTPLTPPTSPSISTSPPAPVTSPTLPETSDLKVLMCVDCGEKILVDNPNEKFFVDSDGKAHHDACALKKIKEAEEAEKKLKEAQKPKPESPKPAPSPTSEVVKTKVKEKPKHCSNCGGPIEEDSMSEDLCNACSIIRKFKEFKNAGLIQTPSRLSEKFVT